MLTSASAFLTILTLSGKALLPWLPAMHEQCAKQLRLFPYLYAPLEEQYISPTDTTYVNSPESLVAIVKNKEDVVGIAAGIPLNSPFLSAHYFSNELLSQFQSQGHDPDKIWYMGYFLMNPEYQEDAQLIHSLYELFADHARALGKTQLCYVDALFSEDHPLKPLNYQHPEPWERLIGGFISSNVNIEASWPTLQSDGSVKEETHPICFYLKDL